MMRTLAITITVVCLATTPVVGQIPVTDVATPLRMQRTRSSTSPYVQMVNNQVQQINTLTQQLQQVTAYVQAFGDPATLLNITGANELIDGLGRSGVGQTIVSLRELADGTATLVNNANGLYQTVGETFTLPSNVRVPRAAELYRKFDVIDRMTENYTAVYDDVADRRQVYKGRLADTTRRLQASTTDAETQKLQGVVAGQAAQLESLDQEVLVAAAQVSVQDIANRNDAEKQKQARAEEQQAEFSEAAANYVANFQLSAEPARFGGSR